MAGGTNNALNQDEELIKTLIEATKNNETPFIKHRSHFSNEEVPFTIPDGSKAHRVVELKKNFKANSSEQRNKDDWLKITNYLINPARAKQLHFLTVLMGEIYRFELGNTVPKYRIIKNSDETMGIVTKKIIECEEFYTYAADKIMHDIKLEHEKDSRHYKWVYKGNDFFEGMGRGLLAKYLYCDDDVHFGNIYIASFDGYRYIDVIDHNRSCWPLAVQFYKKSFLSAKTVSYRPNRSDLDLVFSPVDDNDTKTHTIEGKPPDYIGELDTRDYDTLPILNYQLPSNWQFMDYGAKPYSLELAKHALFKNEKHFSALKACLTPFIKKYLIEYLAHESDKVFLDQWMIKRLTQFVGICTESLEFVDYVKTQRLNVLKGILYEMNKFFKDNKHYLPKDQTIWLSIWKSLTELTIQHFVELLCSLKIEPLTKEEGQQITQFAENCEKNLSTVLPEVIKFYEAQLMQYHAAMANKKLFELKIAQNQNRLFASSRTNNCAESNLESSVASSHVDEEKSVAIR